MLKPHIFIQLLSVKDCLIKYKHQQGVNAMVDEMKWEFRVIKVHDEEAIVKIVDKLAPYVIPRKGDWIDLLDE